MISTYKTANVRYTAAERFFSIITVYGPFCEGQ